MANLLLAVIYLAFISLGLPDPLLGAAWPTMAPDLGAGLSWAGGISMVISAGTIVSALLSDRMTLRLGTGKVTAWSVFLTMVALFGFSVAPNYWVLLLVAIPYGLGAGGVDAALNNYVAIHYASKHMSWLHAMWGIGTLIGPNILGFALSRQMGWRWGYRMISIIQLVLVVVLFASLPLWRSRSQVGKVERVNVGAAGSPDGAGASGAVAGKTEKAGKGNPSASEGRRKALSIREVLAIPGAPEILLMFFCYCTIEQTSMLWASSYMNTGLGISKVQAAQWAALFTLGITAGRLLNGFATMRLSDPVLIRIGEALIGVGIIVLLIPLARPVTTVIGLVLVGLGCAPVYPCIIHSTPTYFGADKSQAIVGMQMAFAYTGTLLMPPLFGLIAQATTVMVFPVYLLIALVVMAVLFERLRTKRAADTRTGNEEAAD